jgi:hypothetical protein
MRKFVKTSRKKVLFLHVYSLMIKYNLRALTADGLIKCVGGVHKNGHWDVQ